MEVVYLNKEQAEKVRGRHGIYSALEPILLFLAVLLLFTGCSERWCANRYPIHADTVKVIITKDTIIYRDTVFIIEVEGERVIDSVLIPCPQPVKPFITDTARAETDFAVAKAWWKFPRIHLDLVQKDTAFTIRALIKEVRHWRSEYEKITKIPDAVRFIPGIYKVALWLWLGVFLAVGGYIGFKFLKK